MILKLKAEEFKHNSERSFYNHNWYIHKDGSQILEVSEEFGGSYFYYMDSAPNETFIGCSMQPLEDSPEIEFLKYYT